MEEKYIWPLVGVALGWVLSLLAGELKDRTENKRKIGRLLAKLFVVRDQVDTLITAAEQIKDHINGWDEYERLRKGITDRHFLEPSSHVESLRASIDDVSGMYPLEALGLHGLVDALLKNKKASLAAMSKHRELYVPAVSVYEAGLVLARDELDKSLRRLAWRHGWITYLRVLGQSRTRSLRRSEGEAFVSKVSGELWAELRSLSEKEAPNPTIERTSSGTSEDAAHVER